MLLRSKFLFSSLTFPFEIFLLRNVTGKATTQAIEPDDETIPAIDPNLERY